MSMSSHLRRFVTYPLPIFEYEFASETRAPPPLSAAAKCLAQCIRVISRIFLIGLHSYASVAGSWGGLHYD